MQDHISIHSRRHFFCLDEEACRELPIIWQTITPHLPKIMDRFHKHISQIPHLVELLGTQGPRVLAAQGVHWGKLFNGRFDQEYLDSIQRIGLIHSRIGLEPRWYIGGYTFLLNEFAHALAAKHRFAAATLARKILLLNKAIMLDMDYVISVYQDALVQMTRDRGEKLTGAITSFSDAVQKSLHISTEASGVLSESATMLDNATGMANTLASQLVSAAGQTVSNMQSGAAATEELAASVREIGYQASRSADVARQALESAGRTQGAVTGLAEQARAIGDVVDLIGQIAAQTNLLALNATIEAAHAGEAGKGFAVVAQEVKALAAQTAKATTEIGSRISAIQGATQKSAAEIEEIARVIEEVSGIATNIAAAVDQQAVATSEIAMNVQQTTDHTQAMVRNIENLSGSTVSANTAAQNVSSAKHTLDQQIDRLRQDIDLFLETARAV